MILAPVLYEAYLCVVTSIISPLLGKLNQYVLVHLIEIILIITYLFKRTQIIIDDMKIFFYEFKSNSNLGRGRGWERENKINTCHYQCIHHYCELSHVLICQLGT